MPTTICAIDGLFLTQRVSGIQRHSIELLAELDKLLTPGQVELVVPQGTSAPAYQNIRVVPFGSRRGFAWEQLDYPRYLKQNHRRGFCTCNVIPVIGFHDLVILYDVCYRARPDFYTDPRGRLSALWHRFQYWLITRKAEKIITISEFSKSEIIKYYHVAPEKLRIVTCGWQQMLRVEPEEGIFDKQPRLQKGEYYFSMANLQKNKNFPWVLQAARNKPEAVFAIAGGGNLKNLPGADLPNVLYLGYVSDGEAKALMAHCKAFLFPTLYEGFGIPPMEAIACGAKEVYVSDTPCMREVYGPYAGYIDLETNHGDVEDVTPAREPAAGVLGRYSWADNAKKLLAVLQE